MRILHELCAYRGMTASLVRKDLQGRYRGSVLGVLWTLVNPLMQLLVYTLVFSRILRSPVPHYALHLFSALVPWLFFSSALTTGPRLLLDQKNLICKIWFPREVLPLAYTLSSLCSMLLSLATVFLVIALTGIGVNPAALLCLIPVTAVLLILVLGVNLLLSSLTVYLRDLEHIMGAVSTVWMYLSPVVYGIEMIPPQHRTLYLLNPMTPLLLAYRDILFYQRVPELNMLLPAVWMSAAVLLLGAAVFSRLQRRFAEAL